MKDMSKAEPVAVCPLCGRQVLDVGLHYICEKSQADKGLCPFKLPKMILKQEIDLQQLQKLCATGRTDLLQHFISSTSKRRFAAFLVLLDNQKITFEFPVRENPQIPARLDALAQSSQNPAPPQVAPPGFEEAHAEWLRMGCATSLLQPTPDYYATSYWKLTRHAALERDGHKCYRCQSFATDVHHLNYNFVGTEHLHSESLVSVCKSCHGLVEHARHAESLLKTLHYRLDRVGKDDLFHAYSRLIEYRETLSNLRQQYETRIPYSGARRLRTREERQQFTQSLEAKSEERKKIAKLEIKNWRGTEAEDRARFRKLVELEIESVRQFIKEVLEPTDAHDPF